MTFLKAVFLSTAVLASSAAYAAYAPEGTGHVDTAAYQAEGNGRVDTASLDDARGYGHVDTGAYRAEGTGHVDTADYDRGPQGSAVYAQSFDRGTDGRAAQA